MKSMLFLYEECKATLMKVPKKGVVKRRQIKRCRIEDKEQKRSLIILVLLSSEK